MDVTLHVLMSVAQCIFPFKKDVSIGAIIPPPLLQYYEVKIQILSVFSWEPALEMQRYSNYKISYFQKRGLRSYSNCGGKFDKLN